jgi:fructose-1,6-bisphosphatase/inositol monophosphatase family enzyme
MQGVNSLPKPPDYYIAKLRQLHDAMQTRLLSSLREQEEAQNETLAGVADVRGGDTIYTIDVHADEVLHHFCEDWSQDAPFVLVSEGIEGNGWQVFPHGANLSDAQFLLIVDPIDGTRNIMYNKRSSWILSGIAPNKGAETNLTDIVVSVMTELPTTRALLADQLWASVGSGASRETKNLVTGERKLLPLRPSKATNLAHGFSSIAKFFPPAKAEIAKFEVELLARVAPDEGENPLVFDDEYISTGGQLYELMVGHDRFLADLRPVFFDHLKLPKKLVCHPYDICVELIAREAGVIVTDEQGNPLSAFLDIRADVNWVGYANTDLQNLIEPELKQLLGALK